MPSRVISVFGSYDFFGKSLPGIGLAIGLIPLLPNNSISPINVADNIFVFIAFIVSVVLVGLLLGEAVHSIAILFEHIAGWLARRLRNSFQLLDNRNILPEISIAPSPEEYQVAELSDGRNVSLTLRRRVYLGWRKNLAAWLRNRRSDMYYTFMGHRPLFEDYLRGPIDTLRSPDDALEDLPTTHQFLIKTATNDLDIGPLDLDDVSTVYPVVTSILSRHECDRAFRLQARYAFCRGMWAVLFVVSIFYILRLSFPPDWTPKSVGYETYLQAGINGDQIGLIAILLLILSVTFGWASGKYKKFYIDYLISEFYVVGQRL